MVGTPTLQERLQGMTITQDVTVSKLSRLQRQILIFARLAMLDKNQKIEPADGAT